MVLDYPAGPIVITRVLQRGDFFPGVIEGEVNMGECWREAVLLALKMEGMWAASRSQKRKAVASPVEPLEGNPVLTTP